MSSVQMKSACLPVMLDCVPMPMSCGTPPTPSNADVDTAVAVSTVILRSRPVMAWYSVRVTGCLRFRLTCWITAFTSSSVLRMNIMLRSPRSSIISVSPTCPAVVL